MNNLDAPYGMDRADEFKENPQLFEKKIKYFTKKYANINNASTTYKVWDFTYNKEDDKNNDNINISFEFDGINRQNFQVKKNEKTENVVLNYFKSVEIKKNYKKFIYYYKYKRLILNKTLEENEIDDNSLIIVINSKNIIC